MGISVFFMWIMNAVVSYLFPLLQAKLGLGPVFFIFAAINDLAILFVVFALPETSNKSLEQLEAELSANHEDKKSTRLTREVGYDSITSRWIICILAAKPVIKRKSSP